MPLLRCINAEQPDLDRFWRCDFKIVQDRDGVAVCDGYDFAGEVKPMRKTAGAIAQGTEGEAIALLASL